MPLRRLTAGALIAATSLWVGAAVGQEGAALQQSPETEHSQIQVVPPQTSQIEPAQNDSQGGTTTSVPSEPETGAAAPQAQESSAELPATQYQGSIDSQNREDPLAPVNHQVLDVNAKLDDRAFHPIASGWAKVVPRPARDCVHRFFENAGVFRRFSNAMFQLKLKQAGGELARFGINSTVGVAGLFDPADKWFGLKEHDTDFSQTLAMYGMNGGTYVIAPFGGPVDVRNVIGGVVDGAMNPMNYVIPGSAVLYKAAANSIHGLNERSEDLDHFEGVAPDSPDLYHSVHSKYQELEEQKERAVRNRD
jgi:phospholipid-binding lipoprotein MlaA